jgi:glycosyltransferase involved in cell wall biosynthesis
MARRVLLLAYMFPPIVDGGAFRPTAFARYLPEFGYEPLVLTRPDSGKLPVDPSQLDKLPTAVRIERVRSGFVDGWQEHFRRRLRWLRPIELLLGRPRGWIADGVSWRIARRDQLRQWEVSWMHPAIASGLQLIELYKPEALIATGPPFETLKAGWSLHQRTRVPLIADFRDPWTYGVLWNPANPKRARHEQAWEARVVRDAATVLVVTPSMQRNMRDSYPEAADNVELVMNGYEDSDGPALSPPNDRFVLRYIGSVMERRLPAVLFEGLRRLRARFPEVARDTRVELVGPNLDASSVADRIHTENLSDMVEWLGPVNHQRSRELMRSSHVLLHIESTATYAVSGKLFEYLAARRHVLGMTPPGSDDEWFLNESGAGQNVGLEDADRLAAAIHVYWTEWRKGAFSIVVDEAWLKQFHRRAQTKKVASILDNVLGALSR